MGLGARLTRWPLEFIEILTSRGYRVIRYDNRDVGLSQKFDSAGPADVVKMMIEMMQGKKPSVAYTLEDMANDAAGSSRTVFEIKTLSCSRRNVAARAA